MKILKFIDLSSIALAAILSLVAVSCEKDKKPETEDVTAVEIKNFQDGIYFGNFWKEGYADYYFILSSGEIGQSSEVDLAPMNPGDYILYCDLWGAISEDHTNPIIPEGTYTAHKGRANGTFNTELTFATFNKEKVGDLFRIENVLFQDGTITVKHIAEGYDINVAITSTEGKKYVFTYKGAITLSDKSGEGEETDNGHIKSNLDLNLKRVTSQKYGNESNYDNYVLRCFDTEGISNDGLYPKGPGHKIQIDLYTEKGADLAGTYKAGSRMSYTPGTFYPGVWLGAQALGTFCMQVDNSYKTKFCAMKDGEVKIVKNNDGTYSITCDFTDEDGYTVKASWKGELEDYQNIEAPQTTLDSDVEMNPEICSVVNYYGDYHGNGTINYAIVLDNGYREIAIDFVAGTGDAMSLPEGTYTVSTSGGAGTVYPGNIGYTSADPSCYIEYDESGHTAKSAPIAGGTMKISRNGNSYTVEFEFQDDYNLYDKSLTPHKIYGSWTGTLPAIRDYTKQ